MAQPFKILLVPVTRKKNKDYFLLAMKERKIFSERIENQFVVYFSFDDEFVMHWNRWCVNQGDCCGDFSEECPDEVPQQNSCKGLCHHQAPNDKGGYCYCDGYCVKNGDCKYRE